MEKIGGINKIEKHQKFGEAILQTRSDLMLSLT
jgi:hypothetical protein